MVIKDVTFNVFFYLKCKERMGNNVQYWKNHTLKYMLIIITKANNIKQIEREIIAHGN